MKYIYTIFLSILVSISYAQDFYSPEAIQSIEVSFSQNNWDQLMDNAYAGSGDYIMASSVTINGVVFDSVGVKYKGNSTYNPNQVKNPWHIELDTYKDQEYDGYTDIKLANVAKDPSFLRDVLAYEILGQYMDAPLANYANLSVNGQLIGLYSNIESISKKFMKSRFGSNTNTRFKCSPPDGASPQSNDLPNLVYLGQDSSDYYDAYELKSDEGWQDLIDLCDTLVNHINDIEKILDVDRALWMLAFDNAIVNLDSYIGRFAQNYYLYRSDYNQFLPVVWDLNESFGVFSQTGTISLNNTTAKQQMTHLLHENDNQFPLVQKLLSVPMYKRMYLAHYKTLLLENFDNDTYSTKAQTLQTLIASAVQADNNKFYTYNNFLDNLNSDIGGGGGPGPGGQSVPGITNLMNGRNDYLLGLNDFSQVEPSISNITFSNPTPELNEIITITATIENENTVYLGYKSESNAPFNRILMYDDGTHNDGAANDGVYGIDLEIDNSLIQFYIYAENNNTGKFSPQRAEYEYHTITAGSFTMAGDLVINEFMASNDSTMADQDGEYDDWIELYNNSSSTIDLSGYYLSDDDVDFAQWSFPVGSQIESNEYLVVWADDDENQTGLHANFKLSASGETITLANPIDTSIIDQVTYGEQTTDISYGRFPNGTGDFQIMTPTFNAENSITTSSQAIFNDASIFNVFPNPAHNSFQLVIKEEASRKRLVSIYNLNGRIFYQNLVSDQVQINTSEWAAGLYFIQSEGTTLKLVIN